MVFADTPGNPFGIPGINEGFMGLAVVYAVYMAVTRGLKSGELLLLLTPVVAMSVSALIAKSVYGQPFQFGLFEERRMLALYFYFPLRDTTQMHGYKVMLRAMMNVALACATIGFAWWSGLLPGWKVLETGFVTESRANFGAVFAGIALILNFKREKWYKLLYIFLFLVFVSQTRQVLIALVIGIFVIFILDSIRSGKPVLFSALLVMSLLVLIPTAIDPYAVIAFLPDNFQDLTRDEYLQRSARARSYASVFEYFRPLGHGALSLRYHGGFANYFGANFFLADIGIVGTIHRFGWLTLLYAFVTLSFIWRVWRLAYRGNGEQFVTLVGATFMVLVTWPTAGILEYRAGPLALLIAVASFSLQRRIVYMPFAVRRSDNGPKSPKQSMGQGA